MAHLEWVLCAVPKWWEWNLFIPFFCGDHTLACYDQNRERAVRKKHSLEAQCEENSVKLETCGNEDLVSSGILEGDKKDC